MKTKVISAALVMGLGLAHNALAADVTLTGSVSPVTNFTTNFNDGDTLGVDLSNDTSSQQIATFTSSSNEFGNLIVRASSNSNYDLVGSLDGDTIPYILVLNQTSFQGVAGISSCFDIQNPCELSILIDEVADIGTNTGDLQMNLQETRDATNGLAGQAYESTITLEVLSGQ